MLNIGIIREEKVPPDFRTPLAPEHCVKIMESDRIKIVAQSSPKRCFPDASYKEQGIKVADEVKDCDILMGVKEVPIDNLIADKTYFFFSHTIKMQQYNRDLLRKILELNIRLIDYEALTDAHGHRLIAFGRHAGKVGAHNALYTYGKRTGEFSLPRMKDLRNYSCAKRIYLDVAFPNLKIVLTGHGRVGNGAATVLDDMGIIHVSPQEFLNEEFDFPVYTQLSSPDYVAHKDSIREFELLHFYEHPEEYKSIFQPYCEVADIMINGIYWDKRAPAFFQLEDIADDNFNIQVIADVTCDIAPASSIPTTVKASTIADPIYGFSRESLEVVEPHSENCIDIMVIDNLPNELASDASRHFGNQFIMHILPELLKEEKSPILQRATVAMNGELGPHFQYLEDYVEGRDETIII